METEIKLSLDAGSRAVVEAHPLFAGAEATETRLVATYYDTPDYALRARGVSLRVRRSGERHVQTVKARDGGGDFSSRCEWEWPVSADALDREALLGDARVAQLVASDIDRLTPVFTTEVARAAREIRVEGGTVVEAAIDHGEVRAGDRKAPICELELELKHGTTRPLFRLAADLAAHASLALSPDSKAERGYALLTDAPALLHDASDLVLGRDLPLADAFPLMMGAACRDFAADLTGATRGDIEGLHRLRAAIRKMRTLLLLFDDVLEPAAAAAFNDSLRVLGRTLGEGRDWDVFVTETLPAAEADLGAEALRRLRDATAGHRRDAHAAVRAALEGAAPTTLLLGLSLWTGDGGWLRDRDTAGSRDGVADRPVRAVLPKLLRRLERRVARRGRGLRSLDEEALHALRKSLKKLRYSVEDVASLFGRRPVARYLARIKKVLADLGRINDASVTRARIADYAESGDPDLARAAAALLAWNAARRDAATGHLAKHWSAWRDAEPFWT